MMTPVSIRIFLNSTKPAKLKLCEYATARLGYKILILSICIAYSFNCLLSESAELSDSESNARKQHFHDDYAAKYHSKTQINQIDDLFTAMSDHRYQDALHIIDNIEKVQPIFPWLNACRTRIYIEMGNLKDAFAEADKAVRRDPKFDVGYAARGQALLALAISDNSPQQGDKALADLRYALHLAKDKTAKSEYHLSLSQCLRFLGDPNGATFEFRKFKKLVNPEVAADTRFTELENSLHSDHKDYGIKLIFLYPYPDWRRIR